MNTPESTGAGDVSNQIAGGIFFRAVLQGRDIHVTLPAEVPPAMTGLPPSSQVFTGRGSMVETLRETLRPDQPAGVQLISAVAGLAGVGKTELVLHTARRSLDEGWFPGGVLFVDLFGYDPQRRLSAADALLGWLTAIGIPGEHIPADEQDRSRLWRSVLDAYAAQNRRLLLVIDNASGEDHVRPLLPTDGRVPVLVTSRHTLDLDARLHDLDVLDPAPALELIVEVVAGRRGPDDPRLHGDGRSGLVELADQCAGLPLALRIVAALLADRIKLQPSALADRLRDKRTRLDGLTREQAAVRAAFDLSYQHLTNAQSRLFRLLPVHPGPDIATATVGRLASLSKHQTTILLADLHRAHLIAEPASERWSMHDLVHLYAAEKRSTNDRQEKVQARQRLYQYYRKVTRSANTHLDPNVPTDTKFFADRDHALAWLDAEHVNLIATAVTAEAQQSPEVTYELAFALADYLDLRRYYADWITVAELSRDIFHRAGDLHSEAASWGNLGNALRALRRFDEAIDAHTRARDINQQIGHLHNEGKAWNNLGISLREVRRFDESINAHMRARDIYQQIGRMHSEGKAWNNLGVALYEVRRFDEAVEAHTRAVNIYQKTQDPHSEGTAWNNLGSALREVRRFDEAVEAHTRAINLYQKTQDLHKGGSAWGNLGNALQRIERFDEAIEAHTRARNIFQVTGDLNDEAKATNALGTILAQVGRFNEAIDAHKRARDIFRFTQDRHEEGSAWVNLATALLGVKKFDEASESYIHAQGIFEAARDLNSEGIALNGLGTSLTQAGRYDEAIAAHIRARQAFQETNDLNNEGAAANNLAVSLSLVGRLSEARFFGEQAVVIFTKTGDASHADNARSWLAQLPHPRRRWFNFR